MRNDGEPKWPGFSRLQISTRGRGLRNGPCRQRSGAALSSVPVGATGAPARADATAAATGRSEEGFGHG